MNLLIEEELKQSEKVVRQKQLNTTDKILPSIENARAAIEAEKYFLFFFIWVFQERD
jgi:hypothetical protein